MVTPYNTKLMFERRLTMSDMNYKLSSIISCLNDVWESFADPIENITNEKKIEKMDALCGAILLLKECSKELNNL